MKTETFEERTEENISIHIFSVSAGMVGACFTIIGLLHISNALKTIEGIGDDLIALDSMLFLLSCLISYFGIKTKERGKRLHLERVADLIFILAISLMVLVIMFIVWKLI